MSWCSRKQPLLTWIGLVCASISTWNVWAAQDSDLIPGEVLQDQMQPEASVPEKPAAFSVSLEDVFSSNQWRDPRDLILGGRQTSRPDWSNLMQLGFRTEAALGNGGSKLVLDALLMAESADQQDFKASRDTHAYFKELYATVPVGEQQYWDVGRIIMRNGVGTGFNPTDYFRTNALISRTSEDPSQLRTNRLGAIAWRWQSLGEDSAWSLAYAPKIAVNNSGLATDASVIGQDLQRTNDRERALLRYGHTFDDNVAADVSLYSEAGHPQLGLNLSYGVGQKLLLTLEGNLARRQTLLAEGFSLSPTPLSSAITGRFGSDFSYQTLKQLNLGGSYTSDSNITTLIEFHYNEAGLNKQQWRAYFDSARSNPSPASQLPLLLVRQQASTRQEPISRNTLFSRVTLPEIFHPDLTLTLLMVRDLEDRSYLFQSEVAWLVSKRISAKLRYATFRGNADSNYGSNALQSSLLMQISCAF